MKLNDKVKIIRDVFLQLDDVNVYHYWREHKEYPCIVWAEDTEGDSLHADNGKREQVIHGTTDLFSRTEYDPLIDHVQDAMNDAGVAYRLLSVQYEDDTNLIHYEWEWEV